MADSLRGALLDSLGRPINGALVKVYDAGTASLSSIYSDANLTVPVTNDGLTSPLTEADGSYGPYYVANGRYDVKPSKSGYTFDDTDLADQVIENVMDATQRISGLVAEKGWDGVAARSFNPTAAANAIPVRNATKDVTDRDGFNLFGFVESALGPDVTLASNTSGSITVAPGDYFLVVADAEIDGGVMPTYPYGHLSYSGGGITARFITTYSVLDYPLASKSAAAMVGSAASILTVTAGSGAMTVTNLINYTGGSGLSFVNRIGVYRLKRL